MTKRIWQVVFFTALLVACAVFCDPWFHGADEPVYWAYTQQLAQHGDFNIAEAFAGQEGVFVLTSTFNYPDFHNNAGVLFWVPFFWLSKLLVFLLGGVFPRLLSLPPDFAAKCLMSFGSACVGVGTLLGAYALCRRFAGAFWCWLGVLGVMFATPYFYYVFLEGANANVLAGALGVFALWFCFLVPELKKAHWFAAGVFFAFAIAVKTELLLEAVMFVGLAVVFAWLKKMPLRNFALFFAGAFIPTALRAANAYVKYGSLHMEEIIYVRSAFKYAGTYNYNGLLAPFRGIVATSPFFIFIIAFGLLCVGKILFRLFKTRKIVFTDVFTAAVCLLGLFKLFSVGRIFAPAGDSLSMRVLMSEYCVWTLMFVFGAGRLKKWAAAPVVGVVLLAGIWNWGVVGQYISGLDRSDIAFGWGGVAEVFKSGVYVLDMFGAGFYELWAKMALLLPLVVTFVLVVLAFSFLRLLRSRGKEGFAGMGKRTPAGALSCVSVLFALCYAVATFANVHNNTANVRKLKKSGMVDKAQIEKVSAFDMTSLEKEQHLWSLFELKRYFALKGKSGDLKQAGFDRKRLFGQHECVHFGTFDRPLKPFMKMISRAVSDRRFEVAVKNYEKALAANPDDFDTLLGIGDLYFSHGRYTLAAQAFEKAFDLKPDSLNACLRLAQSYEQIADFDRAALFYERYRGLNPAAHNVLKELGEIYTRMGKYAKAIECFELQVESSPSNPDFYNSITRAYMVAGKYDKAERSAKRYMELLPSSTAPVRLMVDVARKRSDMDAQRRYLEKLETMLPADKTVLDQLASFYLSAGLNDEFIRVSLKLLELGDDRFERNKVLAEAYARQGKVEKAVQAFKAALEASPENTEIMRRVSQLYESVGNYAGAIEYAKKVAEISSGKGPLEELNRLGAEAADSKLRINTLKNIAQQYPNDVVSWLELGDVYIDAKQNDLALKAFETALSLEPASLEAIKKCAGAYSALGQYAKAAQMYEKLAALQPAVDVFFKLSEFYNSAGDFAKSANALSKARELDPQAANLKLAQAKAFENAGEFANSLSVYESLLKDRPADVELVGKTAQLNVKLGNFGRAVEIYVSRFDEADPDSVGVALKIAGIYATKGVLDKKLEFLEKAYRLSKARVDVANSLGQAYSDLKLYEKAVGVYENVYTRYPDDLKAALKYADVLAKSGNYDTAQVVLERLLEKAPNRQVMDTLVDLFTTSANAKGLECVLVEMSSLYPEDTSVQDKLYELYLRSGQKDRAVLLLEKKAAAGSVAALNKLCQLAEGNLEYGKAAGFYERIVSMRPTPGAYLKLADLYAKTNSKKAVEVLEKALESFPGSLAIVKELSELCLLSYDYAKARDYLMVLAKEQSSSGVYVQLAEICEKQQDFKQAGGFYARAFELEPDAGSLCLKAAKAFKNGGDFEQAEKYFTQYVELGSSPLMVRSEMLHLYELTGQYAKALEQLNAMAALAPTVATYKKIAEYARKTADTRKLKNAYAKLMELEPQNASHALALAKVFAGETDTVQAENMYKRYVELGGEKLAAHLALAQMFEQLGNTAKALVEYERSAELEPVPGTYEKIAELARKQAQWGKVKNAYAKLLELSGQSAKYALEIAQIDAKNADIAKAEHSYARYVDLGGSKSLASLALAQMYEQAGNVAKALAEYERSAELEPVAGTYEKIAELARKQADVEKLENAYVRLAARAPANALYALELARIYAAKNDFGEAEKFYGRYVENSGSKLAASLELASMYEKAGRKKQALEQYKVAAGMEPCVGTYEKTAELARATGDLAGVYKAYEKLLELVPGSKEYMLELARLSAQERDYENAKKYYEKFSAAGGDKYTLHTSLAQMYEKAGDFQKALEQYGELCVVVPSAGVFEKTAEYARKTGNIKLAVKTYEDAFAHTGSAVYLLDGADVAKQAGEKKQAYELFLRWFEKTKDISPPSVARCREIAVLAALNADRKREMEFLELALALAQNTLAKHEIEFQIAYSRELQGLYEQALAGYENLFAQGYKPAQMLERMAQTSLSWANMDKAREYYEKLIKIEPGNTQAFSQLESIYAKKLDSSALLALAREKFRSFPDNRQVFLKLVELLLSNADEKAIDALFDQQLDSGKWNVSVWLKCAEMLGAYSYTRQAEKVYEHVLDGGDNPEAMLKLAELYAGVGENKKADRLYEGLVGLKPENTVLLAQYASFLNTVGWYEKAVEIYKRLAGLSGKKRTVYSLLSGAQEKAGDFAGAAKSLALYVGQYSSAGGYEKLYDLYTRAGDSTMAAQMLEKALEFNPSNWEFNNRLADMYVKSGEFDRAFEKYDKVIAAVPGMVDTYWIKGSLLFELGRYSKALDVYKKALEVAPGSMETYRKILDVYTKTGNSSGRIECLWTMSELDRGNMEILEDIAATAGRVGDFKSAQKAYESIFKLAPDMVGMKDRYAGLCESLGKFESAGDALADGFGNNPGQELCRRIIDLYAKAGKPLKQLVWYERLCKDGFGGVDDFVNMANMYRDLGQVKNEIAALEKRAALDPGNAEYKRLGALYEQLGDKKSALGCYQRCLEHLGDGKAPWAVKKIEQLQAGSN